MKKVAILVVALALAAVLFGASFVAVVGMRGGLGASHAKLARLPLIGGMLKVQPEPESEAQQQSPPDEPLPEGRDVPFLRFGPQERLKRLVEELQAKQTEHETAVRELERRARELDAWESQLTAERDALRARFTTEKEELVGLKEDLARRQAELDARQVLIAQTEEANIKKTAEIYAKMAPERSSELLTAMYGDGQQDTVVKIIYMMQDRSAAKALEAITDPKIGAEITQALKQIGKEVQPGG
ncbi:MAG: hypothetical protein AMK73_00785 [Planctomycetes bacterium SM23_32]|nr:MAG: hypothetical protein AMK73_00785 [Planctomycetes bacterium SM23_32]